MRGGERALSWSKSSSMQAARSCSPMAAAGARVRALARGQRGWPSASSQPPFRLDLQQRRCIKTTPPLRRCPSGPRASPPHQASIAPAATLPRPPAPFAAARLHLPRPLLSLRLLLRQRQPPQPARAAPPIITLARPATERVWPTAAGSPHCAELSEAPSHPHHGPPRICRPRVTRHVAGGAPARRGAPAPAVARQPFGPQRRQKRPRQIRIAQPALVVDNSTPLIPSPARSPEPDFHPHPNAAHACSIVATAYIATQHPAQRACVVLHPRASPWRDD